MQSDAFSEAGVRQEHIYFDQFSGTKLAQERPPTSKLLGYNASGYPQRRHRLGGRMQATRGGRLVERLSLAVGS